MEKDGEVEGRREKYPMSCHAHLVTHHYLKHTSTLDVSHVEEQGVEGNYTNSGGSPVQNPLMLV